MSTNPGVTTAPSASMRRRPSPSSASLPTAVMRSPSTATSARLGGAPVPSTTVPPAITRPCGIGYLPDGGEHFPDEHLLGQAGLVLLGAGRSRHADGPLDAFRVGTHSQQHPVRFGPGDGQRLRTSRHDLHGYRTEVGRQPVEAAGVRTAGEAENVDRPRPVALVGAEVLEGDGIAAQVRPRYAHEALELGYRCRGHPEVREGRVATSDPKVRSSLRRHVDT